MKTILLAITTILLLSACTSGEKPPTYAEIREQHQSSVRETEAETVDPAAEEEARLREEHSKAVAAILTENRDVRFGTTVFGTQTAVECDGGIYINCGMKICLLNRKTGFLQGLCNDPLCRHDSCIESHWIDSMVTDGDRLYFRGSSETFSEFSSKKWDKSSFIASYDPENDKFEFLDVWEKDRGTGTSCMTLHGGYLYYTKKMNEQTNSLFRISVNGGTSKQLTFKDELVIQWMVTDENIIYRTDAFTLKRMNTDGSNVEILEEFICMTYSDGNDFLKISSKDADGHAVYRNDEMLPDRVYLPVTTVLTDGALWYTIPNKQNLGSYTDKNGRKHSIVSQNGTSFYQYNLTTGDRMEYDCPFAYGVQEFCGSVGKYMIVKALAADKLICYWIFNPEDPSEAYRLYEY